MGMAELSFFDLISNKERMWLGLKDFEGTKIPFLIMFNNEDKEPLVFRVLSNDEVALIFYDKNRKERLRLHSDP